MRIIQIGLAVVVVAFGGRAFAQESEFVEKMQEDLDGYKGQVESSCGAKVAMKWSGGKLGHNPRESEKPEWNGLSTLCTSAIEGVNNACSNKAVKKALGKVKTIECTKGKGTISYKLKGSSLALVVDASFVDNNAAGQRDDLATQLKKDLDK